MSIIRSIKTKNYSIISNALFRDPTVSARAKGVYAYLMTLPDDWKLRKGELPKHFSEGRDAVSKAFVELETLGYIKRKARQTKSGQLDGWDFDVFESPELGQADLLESSKTAGPHDGEAVATKDVEELKTENTNNNTSHHRVKKTTSRALLAHAAGLWASKMGGVFSYPRCGAAFKRLSAMYTEEQIAAGWENYLRVTDAQYVSYEGFASRAGLFMPKPEKAATGVNVADMFGGGLT